MCTSCELHQDGQLEPKAVPTELPGKVTKISGRVAREVVAEGEEAVQMAWLTVPIGHADEPALAVMDRLLDDAKVGLLNTELELTQKLPEAGSFSSNLHEAGYFGVRGRARAGQTPAEIESLIMGVLSNGANLLGISSFTQQIVIGVVIVLAVTFDEFQRRRLEAAA